MSHGHATARNVACTICGVEQFAYCVNPDGTERVPSHHERVVASRAVSDLTQSSVETLRKLHVDPTRQIHPAVRKSLLDRKLIESLDAPARAGSHIGYPKRRHPLTQRGRDAIAAWILEQA